MTKRYFFTFPTLLVMTTLILFGMSMAVGERSIEDLIAQEESGIEMPADLESPSVSKAPHGNGLVTNTIPQDSVLLIPNSTDDDVGMYDPFDGDFLGILISDTVHLSTPICAMKGPDGNIYVSDQIGARGVHVYDTSGTYLYTYCDTSDGLYNVRGIDFRNDTLFVTSGDDYVARFDAPHNRLPDFIADGSDPFDIHFLDDGRALLADIQGTTDNVRLYNADGTFAGQIFSVSFPQQVIYDDLAPGDFLNASFSDDVITDFDLDGTIHQTTSLTTYGRGVYRLGNGNLLAAIYNGVYEIEPGTGNVIEQKNTGSSRFIELFVVESGPPPTGRCCYNDFQDCVDTTQAACTALGGVWDEALNCIDDPCLVYTAFGPLTQSFDPISPQITGGAISSPADVVIYDSACTSTILWPNEDLGLPDYANIDAFSDGLDMIGIDVHSPPPDPNSYIFVWLDISVDRSTTGLLGSLIESEVLTDGASSDTYEKNWEWPGGGPWIEYPLWQYSDASCVSPDPPVQTDINAICWSDITVYPVFFSVDRATAESLSVNPGDILTSLGDSSWSLYAADTTLGLTHDDNINALGMGGLTVVSLSADSPTAQNDISGVGSGGLFMVPGAIPPIPWMFAIEFGLNTTDDLNALRYKDPAGGECTYVVGDVNGSDSYNGLDITYGVAYFKGGSDPLCPFGSCPIPPCDAFFYCGDVNGSCTYNGLDITYGVAYFKGGPAPMHCADCPPNR